MDDRRQSAAGRSVHGTEAAVACPGGDHGSAAIDDRRSIAPVLASLASGLVATTRAAAAAITVFDGENRWITVTHGPVEIVGDALFPILHEACGGVTGRPATVSSPDRLDAVRDLRLLVAGRLPSRLDVVCMTGRSGAPRAALCLIDALPQRDMGRPGAQLAILSEVVTRLLDLHDGVEDDRHMLMLGRQMRCVVDPDGVLVWVDDALQAVLGVAPGPDLDRWFRALVHPDDAAALAEAWRHALAGGSPVDAEYRLLTSDGGYRWFRTRAGPRRDASGRVTRWRALVEDMHEHRQDSMRLAHLAYHDALTGLDNRASFRLAVERRLDPRQSPSPSAGFAVARLELHELRGVTDAFGHVIGDRLLLEASRRIGAGMRKGDLLAFGGGNKFLLLLDSIETQPQAMSLLDDVLQALAQPIQVEGSIVAVSASIGAALADGRTVPTPAADRPGDGAADADSLMQQADLALLRARSGDCNGCCFYSPDMDESIRRAQALRVDMTRALHDEQLFLLYQPVLDVRSGCVVSLEALVRWNHPERGIVSPAEFIPEAESNGLIVSIGRWVLEQACREAASWSPHLRVGVNLSSVQVRASGLVDVVVRALEASGLDPSRLVLEITESVPLLGASDNLATLRALSALGVQIALDDFGTGYASLSYLQCFSFDAIKIERSFVQRMRCSEEARIILRAVVRLSRSLGSSSVAEGVETAEQLEVLREEGCDCVQGFLFSRPVPAAAVPGVVAALDARANRAAVRPRLVGARGTDGDDQAPASR